MVELEIFKHDIKFDSWGEIYTGLKRFPLSPDQIVDLCNDGRIAVCNEDRMVQVALASGESLYELYEIIKKFIHEDDHIPIVKNEDESSEGWYDYINSIYLEIWILEIILRIDSKNISKAEKVWMTYQRINFGAKFAEEIFGRVITALDVSEELYDRVSKYKDKQLYKYKNGEIDYSIPEIIETKKGRG